MKALAAAAALVIGLAGCQWLPGINQETAEIAADNLALGDLERACRDVKDEERAANDRIESVPPAERFTPEIETFLLEIDKAKLACSSYEVPGVRAVQVRAYIRTIKAIDGRPPQ